MIVNQDHTCGALDDCSPKNFPGMYEGCVQDSPGYQYIPENSMLGIQEKGVELLLPQIPKEGAESGEHIGGAPDGSFFSSWVHRGPPSQLQGGHDLGGGGPPNSGNGLQNTGRKGGETTKRPGCTSEPLEKCIRQIQSRAKTATASHQDGQKLPNR
jgi:hypothetical protein